MKRTFAEVLAEPRLRLAEPGPYGVAWVIEFRFYEPAWYADRAMTDRVVDVFAHTRWWEELHMLGRQYRPGASFSAIDEVKDAIGTGEPGVVTAARGEPEIAVWHQGTDAALKLDASQASLEIMIKLQGGSFEQHSDAILTDTIEAVFTLAAEWRDHGRLAYCVGCPHPSYRIVYPRPRPLRTALRTLDAVVDIVDPDLPPELVNQVHVDDARAIAATPPPAEVQRTERDGLVALRWVENPADRAAMERACAAHERWVVPLIRTQILSGWNESGDFKVSIGSTNNAKPFSFFDRDDRIGYLEVTVGNGGEIDEASWNAAVAAARKGTLRKGGTLNGVAVITQDRAAALRIAERARGDGLRPLYRAGGSIWNPFPPGTWQE